MNDQTPIDTLYDVYDRNLYKISGQDTALQQMLGSGNTNATVNNASAVTADPSTIGSGVAVNTVQQASGNTQSGGKETFDNTKPGYILGFDPKDGYAKFYIGDSTNYLNWTGTSLVISGSIIATSGTIGGWMIGATTISSSSITLDSLNQTITVGSSSGIVIDGPNHKITSSDGTTWALNGDGTVTGFSSPYMVNADETVSSYDTHEVMLPTATSGAGLLGWLNSFTTTRYGFNTELSASGDVSASIKLAQIVHSVFFQWSTGKIVRIKFRLSTDIDSGSNNDAIAFGLTASVAANIISPTGIGEFIGFIWKRIAGTATLYTKTADGAANTNNSTTSPTCTNQNIYEIVWISSSKVNFYVNGTLIFSHTTNIPSSGTDVLLWLEGSETGHAELTLSNPIISIQS